MAENKVLAILWGMIDPRIATCRSGQYRRRGRLHRNLIAREKVPARLEDFRRSLGRKSRRHPTACPPPGSGLGLDINDYAKKLAAQDSVWHTRFHQAYTMIMAGESSAFTGRLQRLSAWRARTLPSLDYRHQFVQRGFIVSGRLSLCRASLCGAAVEFQAGRKGENHRHTFP
jgi:hypothetical protein